MITITPPRKSTPQWNIDQLKYPNVWAAFEKATRKRLHRKHLLSRNPHCHYCGRRVRDKTSTLDHVLPESRGGTDDPENLVLACHGCNQCKGDRTPLEWVSDILNGPKPTI